MGDAEPRKPEILPCDKLCTSLLSSRWFGQCRAAPLGEPQTSLSGPQALQEQIEQIEGIHKEEQTQ